MSAVKKIENQLPYLPLPESYQLACENASWLNLKSVGVKDLAKKFEEAPNKAIVLGDRQFKDKPVVITRVENYDNLLKTVRDLSNGEAFVRNSMEALSEQIALVSDLVEQNKSSIDKTLLRAFKVISTLNINITSIIEPHVKPQGLKPRKTTAVDLDI